jgi:serine/threonine protein phosphatase PrpC
MEDTFIAEDELPKNNACSLFAVFDGHGGTEGLSIGAEVAIFAARHFSEELQKHELFRKFQYTRCLTDTFFKMDALMRS